VSAETDRTDNDYNLYQHGPSIAWTIFDGLLRQFETQRQRCLAASQEALEEDARRVLVNGVASAFHLAMQASDYQRIARESADFDRQLLDVCRRRLKAGVAMDVDCMNFQVRVNNAELDVAAADLGLATAVAALRELLGPHAAAADACLFPTNDPACDERLLAPTNALGAAMVARPDLRSAAARAEAAQAAIKVARAAYWPTVAVSGHAQYEDESRFSADTDGRSTFVGAALEWPLFEGGRRYYDVRAARAEADAAARDLESLKSAAGREIEEAQATVRTLRRTLTTHRETVALSLQIRDLVRQRYEMGLESITRLNQALNDATAAERALSATRAGLAIAAENLRAAVGENLAPPARP
jgi:multidrug efflux system outer membrane protein